MEKHPISDLAIDGNCILFGKGTAKGTKYMDCRPIRVVKKRSMCEFGNGLCEYSFETDNVTDPMWRNLFDQNSPTLKLVLSGHSLTFRCKPEDLESSYKGLKAAMEKTNADYSRERESVFELVRQQNAAEVAEAKAATEQVERHKQQFDALEL
jgi:hypothetical protein